MIARDAGGFPIEQEAYDATLRSLDRIIRENEQLRGNLSLAEEGLANYAQEVERLTKERDKYKEVLRICSREAERQLRDEVERLKEDIQELTCGDPRKVCPNCGPSSGHPSGDGLKKY